MESSEVMSNGEESCNGGSMQLSNDVKENELEIRIQENLDAARLTHMSRGELIHHCNQEMTKLKRNHESVVQHLTEENFILRRELLRERGASLPSQKIKESDVLRRRICDAITKLEVLVEKKEVATFGNNEESVGSLRHRVDLLLSENQQFWDMLTDKRREIECLSLQVSEAEEKMLEHSLSEAQLVKTTANLKSSVEDAHIEAYIVEVAFSCILKGMMDQIKCTAEESPVEAALNTQPVSQCEIEDLNMEYMQELSELVYKEALKEAEEELNNLNMKYIDENERRILLEIENLEKGNKLEVEIANKERLKQEVFFLAKEKDQLAQYATAALEKEIERYDATVQELDNLRGEICRQQKLILESNEESNAAKTYLNKALKQIERQKADICQLDQKLELARKVLREFNEQRRMLLERNDATVQELDNLRGEICQQQKLILESIEESNAAKTNLNKALEQIERQKADICKLDEKLELARKELREVNEERQNALSLAEAKERELKDQLELTAVYIRGLSKAVTDFESRVQQDISLKCSRLKSLSSKSHLLKQKANVLVRRGNMYKKTLERKCADLEKAESEVDLLGDEVDTLSSLVEKIYIALDHYSPILQHYPGVTETLKLIRRELSKGRPSARGSHLVGSGEGRCTRPYPRKRRCCFQDLNP